MLPQLTARMSIFRIGLVGASLLAGSAQAQSPSGEVNLIRVCVNKSSGEMKVVAPKETCKANERPVDLPALVEGKLVVSTGDFDVARGDVNLRSGNLEVSGAIHTSSSLKVGNSITIGPAPADVITASSGTINFANTTLITAGRIGIGTLAPNQGLHVVGNVRIEGDLSCATTPCIHASDVAPDVREKLVPPKAVMFFNSLSCPVGWRPVAEARGRYLVGLQGGGGLALAVGTPLSNGENRPAGLHTHPAAVDPASHAHGANDAGHGHWHTHRMVFFDGGTGGDNENPTWDNDYEGGVERETLGNGTVGHANVQVHGTSLGVTVYEGGTGGGTNAPYLQLLVCEKQ